MELSEQEKREAMKRLLLSRMRILNNHGFYGLLLMHMRYGLDTSCPTAYTDGRQICFSPDYLNILSEKELDFIMMHEILHVVLRHCFRGVNMEQERYNIASDIVVNSNILWSNHMDLTSITVKKEGGAQMHLAPDGKEGYLYTAEEVYQMLPTVKKGSPRSIFHGGNEGPRGIDDHNHWKEDEESDDTEELWEEYILEACESVRLRDPDDERGLIPLFAQRMIRELKQGQVDWRTLLNNFVQEEITDYSFSPPDRRFDESNFFLPDFNEPSELVRNILFMVDTSGSISDEMLTVSFSEIKSAIAQYNGRLQGWLGFFDAQVTEPRPFEDADSMLSIPPVGGGGTSFEAVFHYVRTHMAEDRPASIIILTDGYAPFPDEDAAMGIPVIWLLNNEEVQPPWGKVARVSVSAG